jgi:aminoglycoside phosphotransferase (APT) family kinase protein
MSFIDSTSPVRSGEELDHKRIEAYLKQNIEGLSGELIIEQFPSGHSNLTYLVRVGDRELVLRRPPFGAKNIKAGHDMQREYRILSKLYKVYAPAPQPFAYCENESIMGAPFYVMERKKGVILRKDLPAQLDLSPDTMRTLSIALIDNLVDIHNIDWAAIGLDDIGKPDGFLKRQVDGWADRYYRAQTDEIAEVESVVKWFNQNIPQSPPATLIHNDYKFDNVVLNPNDFSQIIGVLDWEMSTIGDPLLDLGVTLSYWVRNDDPEELLLLRTLPTNKDGAPTRGEIAELYAKKTGRDLSHIIFYFAFALFKLAVIIQQIYYRYAKGYTQDPRFALMQAGAMILIRHSALAIEKESLELR